MAQCKARRKSLVKCNCWPSVPKPPGAKGKETFIVVFVVFQFCQAIFDITYLYTPHTRRIYASIEFGATQPKHMAHSFASWCRNYLFQKTETENKMVKYLYSFRSESEMYNFCHCNVFGDIISDE